MKLFPKKQPPDHILSEGKILEFTPILETPSGDTMALPPVIYQVPNWQLGFADYHSVGLPYTWYSNERVVVPGTNSSQGARLRFLVRVMEHSPDSAPRTSKVIDMKAVRELLDGLKRYDDSGH